jgi:pyruvate dehydrogenase E2 component (dihydrolipoamide acetyltransferase)
LDGCDTPVAPLGKLGPAHRMSFLFNTAISSAAAANSAPRLTAPTHRWHVKEGDTVSSGDVIAEIETDKATMEVEAVDEGTVGRIIIAEGTADVPVNDTIAILLEEGADEWALAGALEAAKQKGDGGDGDGAAPEAEAKAEEKPEPDKAPPKEEKKAAKKEEKAEAAPPAKKADGEGDGRILASPLARRLAAENSIDLAALDGSGPHGRIIKRDIEKALKEGVPAKAEAPKGAPAEKPAAPKPAAFAGGMTDDQIRAMYEPGSYEELPHDGMRKTIARRLVESKQTIPHFYLSIDVELDALLALRKEINEAAPKDADGKPAYRISVNDFVIKAMAMALQRMPMANATFTSTARLLHKRSDVGVAVAIPDGLITPVIRAADQKSLSVISNEMKDLAKRAREKKLKPEEYQGGTTAVSNLGMFGIRDFAAVINPPHSSILAVGEGQQRAVVKNREVKAATVMTVTLSVDHRAVDGTLGAELLKAFKPLIEKPMAMLV